MAGGTSEDGSAAGRPHWLVRGARSGVKARANGFTPDKRRRFLAALKKTGCWRDAARAAPISHQTADRWRRRDAVFAGQCAAALDQSAAPLEMIAWQRAVEGAPEKIIRDGKLVQIRIKPSDAMLRLLLQGSNPGKYGRMAAGRRKEIEKELRSKIEAERRAAEPPIEQVRQSILTRLDSIQAHRIRHGGWWRDEDGCLRPPHRKPGDPVWPAAAAEPDPEADDKSD